MFKEFKKFAMKGNVIDMAVGIMIGVAFGKVVSSLVADIITPPLGLLLGKVDFSNLKIVLKQATDNSEAIVMSYGLFINAILDFIIIAFAIFIIIKQLERFTKKKKEESPAEPAEEVLLLREIRDSLKK